MQIISKQNYLIGQQTFAAACYPSHFSHLYKFLQFFVTRMAFHNFTAGGQIVWTSFFIGLAAYHDGLYLGTDTEPGPGWHSYGTSDHALVFGRMFVNDDSHYAVSQVASFGKRSWM